MAFEVSKYVYLAGVLIAYANTDQSLLTLLAGWYLPPIITAITTTTTTTTTDTTIVTLLAAHRDLAPRSWWRKISCLNLKTHTPLPRCLNPVP